jgi:hypothetical protein
MHSRQRTFTPNFSSRPETKEEMKTLCEMLLKIDEYRTRLIDSGVDSYGDETTDEQNNLHDEIESNLTKACRGATRLLRMLRQ